MPEGCIVNQAAALSENNLKGMAHECHPFADTEVLNAMELEVLRRGLLADKLGHIDMIDCIDRGFAQVEKADDRGVLLKNKGCGQFHLTARDPSFVKEALALCEPGHTLVCHQDMLLDEAGERLGLWRMDFHHGVYTGRMPPPKRGEEPEIRALEPCWLDVISPYYYEDSERELLRRALAAGEVFGAFIEGRLAGFIGCHEEGTYGMLEVLPDFRRRGVGYALERHIIGWLLEQGRIPYCQVRPDNGASLSLQNRLGLQMSANVVHWLFG